MQKGKAKGKDIKSIVKNVLKYGGSQLANLSDLCKNSPSDIPEIFEEVRKSFRKHQAKKEGGSKKLNINLGDKNFGDQEIFILSQQDLPPIKQFVLYSNNIGYTGCRYLSEARWSLQYLFLQHNKIGDKGCKYISRAEWELLGRLHLDQNQVGEKGCQHLSKAIWPQLTNFSLGQNNIGDRGIEQLFRRNWSLEYFTMDDCGITELACRIIGKRHIGFSELYCTGNNIGEMGFNFIAGEWFNDALFAVIYCDREYHNQEFCCQ